jgi:1-acyl-sn-glycerol-3-phosphate acyltransferase
VPEARRNVTFDVRTGADRQTSFSSLCSPILRSSGFRGGGVLYVLRYLWVVLCTVVWGIVALIAVLLDRSGDAVVWCGRRWIEWILWGCRIRVETAGLEHVDREHPQIFMANHQSALDVAAVLMAVPVQFRFVGKREIKRIPFVGWAAMGGGHILIDRGDNASAVARLKEAAGRIRGGTNVVVFPEGTRSTTRGLRPFKSGGFHLAIQSGVPIVPVSVSGSRRLVPKRSLRVHSGCLKVVIGRPIPTRGLGVDDRHALKARVAEALVAGFDPELQEEAVPAVAAQTAGH